MSFRYPFDVKNLEGKMVPCFGASPVLASTRTTYHDQDKLFMDNDASVFVGPLSLYLIKALAKINSSDFEKLYVAEAHSFRLSIESDLLTLEKLAENSTALKMSFPDYHKAWFTLNRKSDLLNSVFLTPEGRSAFSELEFEMKPFRYDFSLRYLWYTQSSRRKTINTCITSLLDLSKEMLSKFTRTWDFTSPLHIPKRNLIFKKSTDEQITEFVTKTLRIHETVPTEGLSLAYITIEGNLTLIISKKEDLFGVLDWSDIDNKTWLFSQNNLDLKDNILKLFRKTDNIDSSFAMSNEAIFINLRGYTEDCF
jgi:hypothetical protein